MLFSVIVPIYKVEAYLPQCIESVLSQSCPDFELILVDDGSPDGCGVICDDYATRDDRITVVHKENRGVAAARNTGIEIAQGEYIQFLDGDDWLAEDALAGIAAVIARSSPDVVLGHLIFYYPDYQVGAAPLDAEKIKGVSPERVINYLFFQCRDVVWSVYRNIFRRELLAEHGLRFKTGVLCGEDVEFSARMFAVAGSFDVFPGPHVYYRRAREGSIMQTDIPKRELDLLDVIDALIEEALHGDMNPSIRDNFLSFFSNYYVKVLLGSEYMYHDAEKLQVREAVKERSHLIKYVGRDTKAKIIQCLYYITGYRVSSFLVGVTWRVKIKSRKLLKSRG